MPPICQVAFSVLDGRRARAFYSALGFRPAGQTRSFRGRAAERIQGLPGAASHCRWLVGGEPFVQLELFEFMRPTPRPRERSACDIGYSRIAVRVPDLERALARSGALPLGPPRSVAGRRCVCVTDPDGVLIELVEDASRGAPADVVGVAASVPDLERSLRFFEGTLGLKRLPAPPEREDLFGLAGAERELVRLDAGPLWLELAEYRQPVPAPWPEDYRLSDQGLLNVAFGFRQGRDFLAAEERLRQAGYRTNSRAAGAGPVHVVYVNDDQGFSVELLHVHPALDKLTGFAPPPRLLAPLQRASFLRDVGERRPPDPPPGGEPGSSDRCQLGDVSLHLHRCGAGRPVVLLHGFPEQWFIWQPIMRTLGSSGCLAVAPELRGYGDSDKPQRIEDYTLDRLAGDIAGVIRSLDLGPVTLVGHDWGGVIGWHTAGAYPELVERFVAINAPHPALALRNATQSPRQLLRSSYVGMFLVPRLPERMLARPGFMRRALRGNSVRPQAFSSEALRAYQAPMASPAARRAAINYYRALLLHPARSQPLRCPALLLYGTHDPFIGRALLRDTERLAPRLERVDLPGIGHFAPQEAPELIAQHVLRFMGTLAQDGTTSPTGEQLFGRQR